MKIELIADDWLMAMGMVGLKRLFEDEVEFTDYGIAFEHEIIEQIPERYFSYLLDLYDVAKRDKESLENELERMGNKAEQFKDIHKNIVHKMTEQKKKIDKYFSEPGLDEVIAKAKSMKKIEEIDALRQCVKNFNDIISKKEINEKLTLNYVKSVILTPLYGQVSFLNISHNKKTIEEQLNIFRKDFIVPAILEIKWIKMIQEENEVKKIVAFLDENKSYPPFKQWLRVIKKAKNIEDIKHYMDKEVSGCTFIDGMPGTYTFEEMVFNPLGIPLNGAINFYWELNNHKPVPISALARLILFLIPVGTVAYRRKIGFGNQADFLTYFGFLHFQDKFEVIYQKNNEYKQYRLSGNPFDQIIIDLLKESQHKAAKKDETYLFIEFYAEYPVKKTLLDYYHMPTYAVKYFKKYANSLKWIDRYDYREAFIRDVLKGIDPKQSLFKYFLDVIHGERDGYGAFIATRERFRILNLKKGVENVKEKDKLVYKAFFEGKNLRNAILKQSNERAQLAGGQYTASGNKRIQGIAYRLLNAVKAGQRHQFLDTVFRLHMGVGLDVPTILLNVHHEKDLDFETVATSFITGLLAKDEKEEKFEMEGVVNE